MSVARRIAQGLGVVLLGVLLLEASLQLVARVAPPWLARSGLPGTGDGVLRVLCVGDSHAFGAGVPVATSYPRRLENGLRLRYPEHRVEVLNLGRPGANSAYVARRLHAQLLELRPRVVVVWVGINNVWNHFEGEAWTGDEAGAGLGDLLWHSRLFRWARLVWETRRGPVWAGYSRGPEMHLEGFPDADPAGARAETELEPELLRRSLRVDFTRMTEAAAALGLPVVFLDYPYPWNAELRDAIRRAAAAAGGTLVDTLESAKRARADGHRDLVQWAAGPHPRPELYRYIAEDVEAQVAALLGPDP